MPQHPLEPIFVSEEHSLLVRANELLTFGFELEIMLHAFAGSLREHQRENVGYIAAELVRLVKAKYPCLFVVSALDLEVSLRKDGSDLFRRDLLKNQLNHLGFVELRESQHTRELVCSEFPDFTVLVLQ